MRAKAAWALAEFGDNRAIEPLIQALRDENQSTACGAIASALGKFADVRAIEPLIAILRSNGSHLRDSFSFSHVKLAVINALRLIADSRTTEIFLEVITDRGRVFLKLICRD